MAAKNANTSKGNPILDLGASDRVYDNPVRCGIVGLGRIGWSHHAQIIGKHGGFELVAICDREADRRKEGAEATGCKTYARLGSMLKDENVELVIVATPTKFHQKMVIQALKAGKNVLCEKPSALSARGIDAMMRAAESAGKLLTMHHNRRLDPDFLYVKETIDSGRLGKVFRIRRAVTGFSRRNDWQVLLKYGGGMIGNWGVHLVDQCLQLLDTPVKDIWSEVNHFLNPGDAEDDLLAIIRGESGMTMEVEMTSVNTAPIANWVVLGTAGSLWIQGTKAHVKYFDPAKLRVLEPNDIHYAPGRQYGVTPDPDTIPWEEVEEDAKPANTYPSYYDNLYAALREGGTLLVEPSSARKTYAVLDKVRRGTGF
ncbi:MAG: Gfo/Idh/MocA family oxidoreductase [Lentisphaeria bacterium]|nr:Gfo/Idh/MocA family oxidoreductase [Lentisphaeria bacterium]